MAPSYKHSAKICCNSLKASMKIMEFNEDFDQVNNFNNILLARAFYIKLMLCIDQLSIIHNFFTSEEDEKTRDYEHNEEFRDKYESKV